MEDKPDNSETIETLEGPGSQAVPAEQANEDGESLENTGEAVAKAEAAEPVAKNNKGSVIQRVIGRLNIYFLLFVLIVVLAIGLVLVGIARNKKTQAPASISSQQLTQAQLSKLSGTDATVGDAKQTLTVESNAIFNDAVLVKGSLDVAGTIKVGGALNLPGISVSGNSSFDQITANRLSIAGDANIQGQLSVQKGLTVTGSTNFGGPVSAPQLTVSSLQLNSDLQINKHFVAGGLSPTKVDIGGIGSGGTTSLSGSDTAGTVTINFGNNPQSNQCYVTINFETKFNTTPHVILSPDSAAASQLRYYANRTSSYFQICSSSTPVTGTATFDYFVTD